MILWLNPFAGISGDMLLGALLDLGAPLEAVRAAVASTGLDGWDLRREQVHRAGLRASQAIVTVAGPAAERRGAELIAMAEAARPESVGQLAASAVRALAAAEARIHGTSADRVHLHELGGIDTIVDTVGVAAAIVELAVTQVWSAPVAVGSGVVGAAHGLLPAPAPATLDLLAGAEVTGLGPAGETVTPTGAALLRMLSTCYGPAPRMRVVATGYGAGSRDTPGLPNILPATLGLPAGAPDGEMTELVTAVETTVDDVTGEVLATLPGELIGQGALDCWISPVIGKKGRPAHVITALCLPHQAEVVESRLLSATGSLGARRHQVHRRALPRTTTIVVVAGHQVRIKIGPHRAKPEHDDVAAAAEATGLPLRVIAEQAIAALDGSG